MLASRRASTVSDIARPRRRWLRWAIGLLLLLVILAPIALSAFVAWALTHPERRAVAVTPESVGLKFEPVEFTSRVDQMALKGWYIPAATASTKAIVIAHGYTGNRLEEEANALGTAKFLTERGYNVLMFDFRASGESAGDTVSVGAKEKWDLAGAVDYVRGRGNQRVGLLGYSMGGATSLQTAAEVAEVDLVVADSSFHDLKDYLKVNMSFWTELPDFPFTPLVLAALPLAMGADLGEISPVSAADRLASRPLLLFHGDADDAIPAANSEAILAAYNAAGGTQGKLVIIPGAKHVESAKADPARYQQELIGFLDQYLR